MLAKVQGYDNGKHAVIIELISENQVEDALLGAMAMNDATVGEVIAESQNAVALSCKVS